MEPDPMYSKDACNKIMLRAIYTMKSRNKCILYKNNNIRYYDKTL